MNFGNLPLNEAILKGLAAANYVNPTPIQRATIPIVLDRKDVIASAETGTGKTAAFALPMLQILFNNQDTVKRGKLIKAVVVSPTRELAEQINESFKLYGKYTNLRTGVVYGGTAIEPQIDQLNKGLDILIATPGRLLDLAKQNYARLGNVEVMVLDEADMLLDMGFVDDIMKVNKLCADFKQSLLFSATMPLKVLGFKLQLVDLQQALIVLELTSKNSIDARIVSSFEKIFQSLLKNAYKGDSPLVKVVS